MIGGFLELGLGLSLPTTPITVPGTYQALSKWQLKKKNYNKTLHTQRSICCICVYNKHIKKRGYINVYVMPGIEDMHGKNVGMGYGYVYRRFAYWLGV